MKLRTILTTLLLLAAGAASAAITSGYYRVISYNSKYMTENTTDHTLVCSDLSTSYSQVWYLTVSGSTVTFKNALTDKYIQGQGTFSQQYSTGTNSQSFTVSESSGAYSFQYDSYNKGGMHCDNSNIVVEWYVSDDKSKWTIEAVTVDQTDLNAQRNASAEATTTQLTNFFTSTACTALKSTYTGYSDTNLRSAMSALPTTVQDLAIKIKKNSWATYSGWDKTEATFRIADYKAYSSHERWTSIMKFGYSMGRLSNPTGIWVNSGEYIQVYVGDIPTGQSVKLEVAGYGQASGTLYSLHQGMNSLLMASSGNCFVFYEVDNTNNGNTPYTDLSSYADVTVHIEGGYVQGYLDITKGDDDSDWSKMKTHLLTDLTNRPSVCLKSDKLVMNLGITRLLNALNGSSITNMMNVWTNLAQWEDVLCGRSDATGQETYGKYCNNVYSVTALPGTNGSPHCSNYGTFYYEYSDPLIFNANQLLTVADNMWCIAHEMGHSRQAPINMAGNTEMSNNLFSNMAIYNQGRFTSRTASIQETFRDFADGISWPERVAKACDGYGNYNQHILHLNWQLYLYFHVLGKDSDFFPRLFDALRADPMTKVKSGSADNSTLTPANTDYLKYYVKCCQVSGCDLTEFFTAYGFFILPPERDYSITYNGVTTKRFQTLNDYGYYYLYATQSMIDNAKQQVKNMNLPKCNIIFIEDRVTAPDATYEGHATGEKKVLNPDAPVSAFGEVGEMGQYTDFDDSVTPAACSYNVTERGHVTVVGGEGAVGFIVYDSSGNPIVFANTRTFTLPEGVTNYTIKAAAANGTTTVSATYNSSIAVEDFPKTNKWYTFKSKGQTNRYTQSNGAGTGLTGTTGNSDNAKQWRFVLRTGETETFDIINRNDGSYISPVAEWNAQVSTSSTQPSSGWKVEAVGDYYIIHSGGVQLNQTSYEQSYKIYNWGGGSNTSDNNCLFSISAVADYEEEVVVVTSDVEDVLNIADNGTDAVTIGSALTSAPSASGVYVLKTGANRYITDAGTYYDVNNNSSASSSPTKASTYYLIKNSDGTWKIRNYYTGKYWGVPAYDTAVTPANENAAGSWSLGFSSGIAYPTAPDANGTTRGIDRSDGKLWGWSTGTNNNHKVYIYPASPSTTALSELTTDQTIKVSATAANTLQTGQWYVMFDRGTNPHEHGYLYENSTSHALLNTATAPSGDAQTNAKYLVRIVGEGGDYYIQTGLGNYIGEITHATQVPTTALKETLFNIKKIASTDAHYYIQSKSSNVVLNANDLSQGDATVVGWNANVPTSIGDNDDWAFYPVELVETYTRSVTVDRWGTICVPGAVAAADISGAEIYTVVGKVLDGNDRPTSIKLAEVTDMEAGKPYLFLATDAQLSLTYLGSTAVTMPRPNNGLVGSFKRIDVATGNYILTDNTIKICGTGCTIDANCAYINMSDVPVYSGLPGVKSITIFDDTTTDIDAMDNGQLTIDNGQIYNLAGQRLDNSQFTIHNSQLRKGIYIVNGKKMLVK